MFPSWIYVRVLSHWPLHSSIHALGVSRQILLWFQNYLSGRKHQFKVNDQYSNWGLIDGGNPWGSDLGPLLFLIYMNSLPLQFTDGVLLQYVDDATVMLLYIVVCVLL